MWQSTILGRTAAALGPRYETNIGEDSEGGYVVFTDPAMYRKEWTGPIYGGIVRYSKAELLGLESNPGADAKIRERVEAAKGALLEQVAQHRNDQATFLKRLAVKVALSFLLLYPVTGRIF